MSGNPTTGSVQAVRVDLAKKLLARALDPACHIGEAENAATKFVAVCRRDAIGLDQLCTSLAPPARTRVRDSKPAACRVRMPFGKYRGRSLDEIAEEDPAYIAWAIANLTSKPEIVIAMCSVAEFYDIATEVAE